jgi:hypothetical protein
MHGVNILHTYDVRIITYAYASGQHLLTLITLAFGTLEQK